MKKLFLFPTKQENPFPVALKMGQITRFQKEVFLLFTGIGKRGSVILKKVLQETMFQGEIIEFGGAASVLGGKQGDVYEIVEILNESERVLLKKTTNLKTASLFCDDKVFRGENLNVVRDVLLFSMESLFFYKVSNEYGLNFQSIRIVTDLGTGDIRKEFIKTLEQNRKKIKMVLSGFFL